MQETKKHLQEAFDALDVLDQKLALRNERVDASYAAEFDVISSTLRERAPEAAKDVPANSNAAFHSASDTSVSPALLRQIVQVAKMEVKQRLMDRNTPQP